MTFPQHLTLLLVASASLAALGQQATPAPVVRVPPKPAQTDTTAPTPPPHLTVSHPVTPTVTPAPQQPNDAPKPPPKPPEPPGVALAQLSAGGFNRTLIVLDPAHGGGDAGSRINDQIVEKDITLALAFRLRSLLAARGFTIVMTRDSDTAAAPSVGTPAPAPPLSLDDRAGIANHARPVACLLLHATASGTGVHLYTSELDSTPGEAVPAPWLTAQSAWVGESQKLASQIGSALGRARIPLVVSRASVRPVDSLTCPALVIELAPAGSEVESINDAGYQQHIAEALAAALVFWQNQAQPPVRLAPPPPPAPIAATTGVTP